MPRSTRNFGHLHNGLVLLLATLLFKIHGAYAATQLCAMLPCNSPQRSFQSNDQLGPSEEDIDNWEYISQVRNGDQNDKNLEFQSNGEIEDWGQDYEFMPTILERLRNGYEEGLPNRSLIMLLVRPPKCDPNVRKCPGKELSFLGYNQPKLQEQKVPEKRSRMVSQRWSAAGLPFSVLYHKQVRAKGSYGNNGGSAPEPQNTASTPQRPTEGWSTHGVTTRRQYSTLPHLFVSYGWGPLGK